MTKLSENVHMNLTAMKTRTRKFHESAGLTRILHEGSGFCSVAGKTVWSIVQTSIAIAMVFEGSAEM
jgi:hypothetical protein